MKAVEILVDGVTDGGIVFSKGQVVFGEDVTDGLLYAAETRRTNSDGELLCRELSKADAQRAARAFDKGELPEPLAVVPLADDAPPMYDMGEAVYEDDEDDEDEE